MEAHVTSWNGGVVFVDVIGEGWRHRLQGMDHYWWTDSAFGMFNSTDQYEGRPAVFYEVVDGQVVDRGDLGPPEGAEILDGIMLPDDLAREYGLI